MKSIFNKIIINANITLLTPGTKGSITGGPGCQSMLAGLYFSKTGYINSYNNSLLTGNRKFSMIHNLKYNDNNLITFKNDKLVLSHDFLEWFRGFTDAEGCFLITPNKANSFIFRFKINLHVDDVETLNYIRDTLQIGKVVLSQTRPDATFEVTKLSEIEVIVEIFSKRSLNTTKQLNFLDFKRAFLLYQHDNSREDRQKIKPIIDNIKSGMNSKRTAPAEVSRQEFNITPDWLLGFIEGDGSFYYENHKGLIYLGIKQTGNKDLLDGKSFNYDRIVSF